MSHICGLPADMVLAGGLPAFVMSRASVHPANDAGIFRMRSMRRCRLSGALVLCAFLASEIAFLGFPRHRGIMSFDFYFAQLIGRQTMALPRPLKSPDAPSANVVSKIAEAPPLSTAKLGCARGHWPSLESSASHCLMSHCLMVWKSSGEWRKD